MTHQGRRPPGNEFRDLALHPARLVQSAFEHSQISMAITDASGTIVLANEAFDRLAGCPRGEATGWAVSRLFTLLRSSTHPGEETAQTGSWQQEMLCRRESGESLPVLMTVDTLPDSGPAHLFLRTFVTLASDNGHLFRERHWVHIDPTTGLPNWLLLRDRLNHGLAQAERSDCALALLFIDIDDFKAINQTHGYAAGDKALGELAQRLQKALRSKDTLARLAGDQFVVVLEKEGTAETAQIVAERLQEALEPPFVSEDRYLLLTVSIGIALYPFDAQEGEALINAARSAMYSARRQGPGRLAFVDHRLTSQLEAKYRLENQLREALLLPEQHVTLCFQPELDMTSGTCTGLEAVLAWREPQRWPMPPMDHLDAITRLGLGTRLKRWAIQATVDRRNAWRQAGSALADLTVTVPLCGSHLANDPFDHRPLDHFLRDLTTEPFDWLMLKLPARSLGENLHTSLHLFKRLERLGIGIVVDELGHGPLELAWLARLPVRKAMIPSALRAHADTDRSLLEGLCRLLEALRIEPVLTGIDDEPSLALMNTLGIQKALGLHLCPPMPADALATWIEGRPAALP